MKAKILVVGGGIMGTSIALKAARRTDPLEEPVVLLERSSIGAGASGRSGAILRHLYHDRIVAAMARDSIREYASFETRTGRTIGFERTGVMTIARDKPTIERISESVSVLSEMGVDVRIVTTAEIESLIPGLQVKKGTIGAWEPGAGFVDAAKTLEAFAALARTHGAVTRLGVSLEEVMVQNGKVVGARTSEGDYTAEKIVIVAGSWSQKILAPLGVDLPLRTVRPENHFFSMPQSEGDVEEEVEATGRAVGFDISGDAEPQVSDALGPRGLHPVLIDLERGFYCRCEPKFKRTRVGRTDYGDDPILADPDDFAEEVSEENRNWAREALVSRLPDYEGQQDAGSIAGWYTLTPDAQAVVGPVPGIEGLYLVTGFSGHGFKLAPSIGTGVAEMLFGDPVSAFETSFYAPGRFQGRKVEWTGQFGL